MVDILFVNPPLSLEERYGHLSPGGSLMPPLALTNLAAVTRKAGYETKILDTVALCYNYEQAVESILAENPRYVAMTAATVAIHNAAELARRLKERNPAMVTMVGGPHMNAVPAETMQRFPSFDIGAVGEGEITIVELLDALENRRSLLDVAGLIIRDGLELKLTAPRPLIRDLDTLPLPAWDLLPEMSRYYRPSILRGFHLPATGIVTSRGCTGKCTFCDRGAFGNNLRVHSTDYVMAMLEELHLKYGMREVYFFDDNLMVFRQRLIQLCEELTRRKWNFYWSCFARVDFVRPDMLALMKRAGCRLIAFGVESGSQEILDFLKKGITLDKALQALRWTREAGIKTEGLFMMGLPLETRETMEMTIELAKRPEFDDIAITIFTPMPGSEITKEIRKYGEFDDDWKKMSQHYPVFVPRGLTREMVSAYADRGLREFYLRPRIMLNYPTRIKSWKHFKAFVMAGLQLTFALLRD